MTNMRKIFILFFTGLFSSGLFAQDINKTVKHEVNGHANDHFMVQLTSDRWLGAPDSIDSHRKNASRGANVYFMLNKPFKSNKHFSAALGLGVGTSHIFLDKMSADITGSTSVLKFSSLDTLTRFKKYKVATAFLEIPVELRYVSKPSKNNAFKMAIGVKAGTLINAHTKGKTLENGGGTKIQDYTQKLTSKSYFNTTRLAATFRVGYGNFCLFGSYNLTPVFKDKVATNMSLLQVGLNFSGL